MYEYKIFTEKQLADLDEKLKQSNFDEIIIILDEIMCDPLIDIKEEKLLNILKEYKEELRFLKSKKDAEKEPLVTVTHSFRKHTD